MSETKPTYTVRFYRNGILRDTFTVMAREAMVVGKYLNGVPHQPDTDQVSKGMPHKYRKAIQRQVTWWAPKHAQSPLCMNLYTLDNKPMGSLFATPNF